MERRKGHSINGGILIGVLCCYPCAPLPGELPCVIYAEELTPAALLPLMAEGIASFVLASCSETAHAAILARNTGRPSLYGISLTAAEHGEMVIVDGDRGELILRPDPDTLSHYRDLAEARQREQAALLEEGGLPAVTRGGRRVKLYANINRPSELAAAVENGAEGVFLKTEFLYLSTEDFPGEQMQYEVYREAVLRMAGKPTVIRIFDIGADKTPPYFCLEKEENPQLGLRGIRLALARKDVLVTQLRAILRAGSHGSAALLLPMVTSVEEVVAVRTLLDEVMTALEEEGLSYRRDLPLGIMIETPAAAIMSEELAAVADFFSIGTNDLTQYILAVDRQSSALAAQYDPSHPAVRRAVLHTVAGGHRGGIAVGVSGEAGGDPQAAEWLVAGGVDLLAVSPAKIPGLKKMIRTMQ